MPPSRNLRHPARVARLPSRQINGYGSVAALLLASGAVALMYEVLWQRQFALLFGSSGPATALVLAAYFGGLGLGSLAARRHVSRLARPLRAYGMLEALIAAGALLTPLILAGVETIYPVLFARWADVPGVFGVARAVIACAALLIPTMAMGATLPVLGQWVDRHGDQLGVTAGGLYVANTAGAALGALAVPFVTLPWLGLRGSTLFCVVTNLLVAATAIAIDRRLARTTERPATSECPVSHPLSRPQPMDAFPAATFAAISGAATFALQVLWNRAFAQVHENSMYSFAVIVATVILALAVGGLVARLMLQRGIPERSIVGWGWLAGGLGVLVMPIVFVQWTQGLDYLVSDRGWIHSVGQLVMLATLLVFTPMALLGAVLPAIMHRAGRDGGPTSSGRVLGRLLAANVLGAVLGALLAGFVLPELLGLWLSLGVVGAGLAIGGCWIRLRQPNAGARRSRTGTVIVLTAAAASLALLITLPRVHLDQDDQLVALDEGIHGIVAVVERPGSRRLKLNNHYALGGTAATGDERMAVHLPLLLHPNPERVALLGLGTGISAGAVSFHPVRQVTAIELVPEVVTAARRHFAQENRGVLDDPRTRVVLDDARHHLRGSGERYDVIVGDLVIPWQAGEGALLTLEQFDAAHTALAPGGLYCQWLPLFQLSREEFEVIARTFLQVFPHTHVWRGDFSPGEPALALVGMVAPAIPDPEIVRRRLAAMSPDPANPHLQGPESVWMHWVGPLETRHLDEQDHRLNSENRPWVQLLGPLRHAGGRDGNLFVGRALEAWLDGVREDAQRETPALSLEQQRGLAAGAQLGDLLLCFQERDSVGAAAARDRLAQSLPAEVLRVLLP